MSQDRQREVEAAEWVNGLIADVARAEGSSVLGRLRPRNRQRIRRTCPDVIVSNNSANRKLARVIVVPLTGNTERVDPGEARVSVAGQSSKAMADQIMTADITRLKSGLLLFQRRA